MRELYIGIDLAWGEKNLSGFCVLEKNPHATKLEILSLELLDSLDVIVDRILSYDEANIFVGIDAALVVPNEEGNREIEKRFNRDFAPYKISMLPINLKILRRYSPTLRSLELFKRLVACGFQRDLQAKRTVFEVYTHATIAVCFNDYKLLPYKRKKGRSRNFIEEQLGIYAAYLQSVLNPHAIFLEDVKILKTKELKAYEDKLDALTCAYTLFYVQNNPCCFYKVDGEETLVSPI